MYNRAYPSTTNIEQWYAIDSVVVSTTPIDETPTYDQPTINVADASTSTSSGTITGTYTIDSELTVGLCTWDHGVNTGFAVVSGGVVSGTVTGLLEGETVVSFSLLDSEDQEATDNATFMMAEIFKRAEVHGTAGLKRMTVH